KSVFGCVRRGALSRMPLPERQFTSARAHQIDRRVGFKIRRAVRRRSPLGSGFAGKKEIAANRRPEIARLWQRQIQRAAITRSEGGRARPISIDDLKRVVPICRRATVRRHRLCQPVSNATSVGAVSEIEKGNADRPWVVLCYTGQRQREQNNYG